ncbi:hypothetical protein Cylst_2111 [Cylindrospermum stagnale PCC 7417]|uniref:DUF4276 domain-containing protein n=1 Tax=Cylindrospermum stagnale PCC 7417 TaxID=56107 RepID=K9WVE0_9NOST|nr:hypothetical protein [Cylindrospermum stagnale]AFZ24350.1 hypothetical protein Cylst_2111 [Cylindrospermum stagnale PCC 7417]
MSQRRLQITILCEDRQQEVFVRYFLKKRGFTGNIKPIICLQGAGEQLVRDNYPKEVKAYRSKNYLSGMLVVLIDADNGTVENRLRQLNNALIEDSQEPRQPNERIAIFVPKRNIETWVHYLQGETVNETDAYTKFRENEAICKPGVEQLATQCSQGNLDVNTPPSLQAACGELQRLLPLLD